MIPLITYICLTFYPPPEPITSTTPWHDQRVIQIDHEPTEFEIQDEWQRRNIRIMENSTDADR
jgi:hypothetical protein